MKKLFLFAGIAGVFVACNEPASETTETSVDTTVAATGETTVTETTTTTTTYAAAEGDVKMVEGKVMIYQNGAWVAADNDVTLDDGTIVTTKGDVKKDGKTMKMEEGQAVTKAGRFFDKAGNAIENAWDKTKEGVKDAGKAVGNAAEKAAEKTKDAFDGDDKK